MHVYLAQLLQVRVADPHDYTISNYVFGIVIYSLTSLVFLGFLFSLLFVCLTRLVFFFSFNSFSILLLLFFNSLSLLFFAVRLAELLQIRVADLHDHVQLVKGAPCHIHTRHILPPSEIDLGLFWADFTDLEGKHLFHRIG